MYDLGVRLVADHDSHAYGNDGGGEYLTSESWAIPSVAHDGCLFRRCTRRPLA